ncbi:multicopper oxidase family protein [Nonomuraea sp. NPDC050536]|uniref:multicopper oxidase family protein n=1 Tax=Nonomuraea sp. NPDC050536 TaxID=3364366 RepID=UPI0037C5E879
MSTAALIPLDRLLAILTAVVWCATAASRLTTPPKRSAATPRPSTPAEESTTALLPSTPPGRSTAASRLAASPEGSSGAATGRLVMGGAPITRGRASAVVFVAALVVTALRVAAAVVLAGRGWWFAGEKVLIALPLLVPPAVGAGVATLLRRPVLAAVCSLTACYAAVAGVVVVLAVGYPPAPYLAGVLVAGVLLGAAATWSMLTRKGPPGRAWRIAGALVAALALAWTGLSMWNARPTEVRLATGPTDLTTLRPADTTTQPTNAAAQPTDTTRQPTDATQQPADAGQGTAREAGQAGRMRRFTLTAEKGTITLASGRRVEALTFNGTSPGPAIRVRQGDLVEVRLRNHLADRGVTLHWHGYRVPNADDGVPGLTQDAVRPGGEFVYRFRASEPGSYWYHTHETPNEGLRQGLFGTFTVDPATPEGLDEPVALHTYGGTLTVTADKAPADGLARQVVAPGTKVRLRVVNTDNGPHTVGVSGTPYTIEAVDGVTVTGPPTTERAQLAAGGRYDLAFTMPDRPALLSVGLPNTGLLLTPGSGATPPEPVTPVLDITRYGSHGPAVPARFDREAAWVLDRLIALRGGLPLLSHTVNAEVWPHIPAQTVKQGEWLRITVVNRSGDLHPMHPHGHHVLVLSRNGVRAVPLWMDSFDVAPGEVWVVALHADNPGVWLAHCHELTHAAEGMTLHLAYEGVGSRYALGGHNHPE